MENKESQVKGKMDGESLALMVTLNIPPEPPPTFPFNSNSQCKQKSDFISRDIGVT